MRIRERKPNRMSGYDYNCPNHYFITICTKDFIKQFGNVIDGIVILNPCGFIAKNIWTEIPNHFLNVRIDEYIIMPDHMHGIIEIVGAGDVGYSYMNTLRSFDTVHYNQNLDRKFMLLSKIIQQYKATVTRQINQEFKELNFRWQKSFYDRIIRTDRELMNVRSYINHNPNNYSSNADK